MGHTPTLVYFYIQEELKMFDTEKRLKKKNERLEKRIKELEHENWELRSTMQYFNQRVRILNEKEEKYNRMLEELEVLKIHYQKAIQDAKNVRKKITKEINKYK